RTEADLFEVVRRAIADGRATVATTGGATWAKVAAALAGSVSTDPDGIVPAMPESTSFFPRYFEGRLLPEFASTGVEAELQSRGALLVKSAGNNGVLAPPPGGLTLDPLWVGWLPGQSLDYRFGEAPAYRYHSGSSTNLLVVGGLMPTASGVDLWAEAPSGSLLDGAIRGQGSCVGQNLLYIAAQQVPVLTPNGSYVYGAGTSFAAPFVSGVVAYLLALDPENPQGKDREAQIARLKAALMDGAASIGGRKVLDAYASARRFLTDPATPKRIRGFDRLMCDCDDGTRHGNDRPAASGPDGSGSSPEWLEGDGRINMAELRAFRDAWLQCHVVFPRLTAAKPVEQTGAYALRLRDLAASGATPWDSTWDESDDTKKKSSYLLWNRFDFDGDGAIAREQPVESATLARLRSDPTLPMVAPGTGLELALLASLWPESLSEA
ncbi:MAG TPA: S8 family serine peptidase, partial [Myxococcota bacterium]|nr:S8 family serine peptidase [Myxococcota bacterium]